MCQPIISTGDDFQDLTLIYGACYIEQNSTHVYKLYRVVSSIVFVIEYFSHASGLG